MKLVYFAWVRERIGKSEEVLDIPADIRDIAGLLDWLVQRGEGYAAALEERPGDPRGGEPQACAT